ncbi:hypothetical protein ACFQH6_19020 [Halobacteriaceae archaeon GCM10025711]
MAGSIQDTESEYDGTLENLERELSEQREELAMVTGRDLPLLIATLRALGDTEIESVEDLPSIGVAVAHRLDALDDRLSDVEQRLDALGDIETGKTTKEQKFAAILAFAENKRDLNSSKVSVTATEIQGAAGVSRRYAYELIDTMPEDVDGVTVRAAKQVPTGSGRKHKKKALLVDCERIHAEQGGVNKFTTRGGG